MKMQRIQKDQLYGGSKSRFKKAFPSLDPKNNMNIPRLKTDHSKPLNHTLMDTLVEQLGFLDYRDLLAAYRYVLEANRHEDYKIRTRASLLSYALRKMKE